MKILKKIALAALVGASMGVFSTSAMAEASDGRIVYAPKEAIDLTVKKIEAALASATAGADSETIANQTKEALDMSKEINANDKVDIARSRANNHLKAARSSAKAGNVAEAQEHLKQALQAFTALKDLL
jgi:primase-polymerase (primpol)-like protein